MIVIPIYPPVFSLSALFIFLDKESDAHISYPFISIHFLPVQPTKRPYFSKKQKMEHRDYRCSIF